MKIAHACADDKTVHIEWTAGRILSLPLWWIPTFYTANAAEREKLKAQDHKILIWDPEPCAMNDELRVEQYLAPRNHE